MTEKCPKCNSDMKSLGQWPDFKDDGKIKETFVCEACRVPDQGMETVRREIVA